MKDDKIKTKLEPILDYLTLSAISKNYFGKSRQYLYHKLNNTVVNGIKYRFNDNELDLLINSLEDISLSLNRSIVELKTLSSNRKKKNGKYYTQYNPFDHPIFIDWLHNIPDYQNRIYVEPFAGTNNIVKLIQEVDGNIQNWNCFDITPPVKNCTPRYPVTKRDTLECFPKGYSMCITNPPYLARNSATRKGLKYPKTKYNDLYKFSLSVILANCKYVAVIVPESFITSKLFHDRLHAVISLTNKMFNDTHCPVCLALFTPSKKDTDFIVYIGDDYMGKYSELKEYDLSQYVDGNNWIFNDPNGEIGVKCVDNQKGADIYFHRGGLISSDMIKISSRTFTRISGLPQDIDIDDFIYKCNTILQEYRGLTKDVFMTSFKGLRKDGLYRRRVDFKTIRCILNKTLQQINSQ